MNWCWRKNKKNEFKETLQIDKVEKMELNEPIELPVELKEYSCIMEIIVVNNLTDKDYTIKSENNFGLSWEYSSHNDEFLIIKQNLDLQENQRNKKAVYINFSILNIQRQTFDI